MKPQHSVILFLLFIYQLTGPIQVASYMKECLLHPTTVSFGSVALIEFMCVSFPGVLHAEGCVWCTR